MTATSGTTNKTAPLAAAQPSNPLREPSFCHEYHWPVRDEFASEAKINEAAPIPQSQNAGGNELAMATLSTSTSASHACVARLRNVNSSGMR